MAEQKVDERKVRQIRTHMAQDGAAATAQRFGEHTPEYRQAQQRQQKRRAVARDEQIARHQQHETKGTTMTDQKTQQTKTPPAQQRAQTQPTAARQRAMAAQKQNAQQNARIAQQKTQSQSQSRGMGM